MDSVEMYDLQTNSWQGVASMPHTRTGHAATTMGGKIYVTGGVDLDGNEHLVNTDKVVVFDPQANMWTQLASMGTSRADHTSAAIGGKLYVFGGYCNNTDVRMASVEAYDPVSNTWAQVSDLTSARDDFVAVAL